MLTHSSARAGESIALALALAGVIPGAGPRDTAGVEPKVLTVTPLSHTFAATRVGTTSSMRTSTVTETSSPGTVINGVDESCASYSRIVEAVHFTDGLEDDRVPATFPVTVYRFVDSQTGTIDQVHLEIQMSFTPESRGPSLQCIVTVDRASGADPTISLTGTGVAPVLEVTPPSLVFADRRIGTNSTAQSFTVANTGDAGQNLTVSSLAISAMPADWIVAFDSTTPIAAGSSRNGTVVFSPDVAGARSAALVVSANDPVDADESIALVGRGLTATVGAGPSPLDIGIVAVGEAATRILVLSNTATLDGATLTVLDATLSGPDASDFSFDGPSLPATIAAGASVGVDIQCRPTVPGVRSATLSIDTDADNAPQDPQIALTCRGVGPLLADGFEDA